MLTDAHAHTRRVPVAAITARQIILLLTAFSGLFVGVWASVSPDGFYRSFPGFGLVWIAIDGPFHEHLIRDVGAFYLALAAASLAAFRSRSAAAARTAGFAWTTFSVPHLAYHLTHLDGLGPIDVVGNVLGVGSSLPLGIMLILLAHDPASAVADGRTAGRSGAR